MADRFCGTDELCYWTVTKTRTNAQVSGGMRLRNVAFGKREADRLGCFTQDDSGAPIYATNAQGKTRAMGILNAVGTSPCMVVFTDIYDAHEGLPGTVK
ncbi:hypothetical protein [Nonomuraea longicatena]|uniref:Transposase n=1 Tax=Nonomuraea longicatena TaxID=83682 RepID=A0ABN1QAS5_9ACTN